MKHRLGRGHSLRAALPRALCDRARAARPARDGAAAAAIGRRAWSGWRSGAALAARRRGSGAGGRGARSGSGERDRSTRRRCEVDAVGPLRPCPLRRAHGAARPARRERARRPGPPRQAKREPVECNATLVAGEPAAVAADAAALGRGRLLDLQAEARSRRRRRPGAGRARGSRAGGANPRRRQRAPGTSETAKRTLAELEPLDVELAEQPVATLEEAAEVAGIDLDPARRRREHREPRRRRAGGGAWAPAS